MITNVKHLGKHQVQEVPDKYCRYTIFYLKYGAKSSDLNLQGEWQYKKYNKRL